MTWVLWMQFIQWKISPHEQYTLCIDKDASNNKKAISPWNQSIWLSSWQAILMKFISHIAHPHLFAIGPYCKHNFPFNTDFRNARAIWSCGSTSRANPLSRWSVRLTTSRYCQWPPRDFNWEFNTAKCRRKWLPWRCDSDASMACGCRVWNVLGPPPASCLGRSGVGGADAPDRGRSVILDNGLNNDFESARQTL